MKHRVYCLLVSLVLLAWWYSEQFVFHVCPL